MADLLQFPPLTLLQPAFASPQDTLALSDPDSRAAALDIQRSWIVEAPAGSGKTGLLILRFLKLLAFGHVNRPEEVLVLTFTRKADGELRDRVLHQLAAAQANDPLSHDAGDFERETRTLAQAVLIRDRARHWRLLDSPAQLNIRTIDSFCAELAASTPLLATGGARRPPVDDAFPLYRTAAERTLAALGGPNPALSNALRELLIHRDAQVQDAVSLIAGMLAQREQWGELIPLNASDLTDQHLDTQVRPRLEKTLARIIEAGLTQTADALGPANLAELARLVTRLSTAPGYKGAQNPLTPCAQLHGQLPSDADFLPLWKAATGLLLKADDHWRRRLAASDLKLDASRSDQQALQDLLAALQHRETTHPHLRQALAALRQLPPARYPEEQWPVVKALCRILRHALYELQQVFAKRGETDFTEIALSARSLLRPLRNDVGPNDGHLLAPDPLTTPAARLTHLLVDEMQDTSAGQYELLESLTRTWDGGSQTLFLVGDPKQSIYAFRQARVERFLRTMNTGRLGDIPLGALRLTANFRSQAALVQSFNTVFEQILPRPTQPSIGLPSQGLPSESSTVPFTSATESRPATSTPALHWHGYLKQDPAQTPVPSTGSPGETQARDIRRHIEDFLHNWPSHALLSGEQLRPPKIAVLARNRAHLAPILTELRGHGDLAAIPFRAVDVEALNERPEVLDLLALTRALLHPADRVAWLAVLRSPFCGLTRADLLALTGEGPEADRDATVLHLVSSRSNLLSRDGQSLLHRTWPTLLEARITLGRTPLSTHIDRTWRSLGGDAPLTPDQRTNALRFLDLLAKIEASPDLLTLPLVEDKLKKLYAEPLAGDPVVELMTIHKAKGLEWDLVLVPSLERGSGRNTHGLFKWLELDNPQGSHSESDFLLAPIQSKGEKPSPLSTWLAAGEQRRAMAEAQRLFYVACTRAREELHLFSTVERKQDGSLCKPTEDSLLRAAWPVAEPILDQKLNPPSTPAKLLTFPPQTPEILSLAAAADPAPLPAGDSPRVPTVKRLPPTFDPQSRFRTETGAGLPYPPANTLPHKATFTRPEGSFAARAFGNALHRFLQLLATRLATGQDPGALQTDLLSWHTRLSTVLRNEGLPPAVANSEAQRALQALTATLTHPEGAWLLAPHTHARNESSIGSPASALRADRAFLAGPTPLSRNETTHLWIVDYKTAEPGGRSREAFLAEQKTKYLPQMQTYAHAAASAGADLPQIILALYFPMLPELVHWPATEIPSMG